MKIKIDDAKRINLYNPEFDEMRHTLDRSLQGILRKMISKDMDAASIGLKIDIELLKSTITDNNAPTGTREAITPEISYRIVSAMQSRTDTKGNVVGRRSNKELLIDDQGIAFLVSKEEASGQLSMFNTWDEFKEAAKAEQHDGEVEDMPFADDPEEDSEEAGEDGDEDEVTEETEDEDDE